MKFKRLDRVIEQRHFRDVFVSYEIKELICSQRPKNGEFLSGRIISLDNESGMLILVFQLLTNHDDKRSINLRVNLHRSEGESQWYTLADVAENHCFQLQCIADPS